MCAWLASAAVRGGVVPASQLKAVAVREMLAVLRHHRFRGCGPPVRGCNASAPLVRCLRCTALRCTALRCAALRCTAIHTPDSGGKVSEAPAGGPPIITSVSSSELHSGKCKKIYHSAWRGGVP